MDRFAKVGTKAELEATRSSAHGMVPGSNIKTGAVLSPPAREGVKSFAVRVTEQDVEVRTGTGLLVRGNSEAESEP